MNNSIAVIDVKSAGQRGVAVLTTQPVQINDDGVRYKFVSNQTIGAKSSSNRNRNNEFDDINMDGTSESGKTSGVCGKCLKCCTIM